MSAEQPKPKTGWFRTEGGAILEMDLPLPPAIDDRVRLGYISQVNEDGSPYEGKDEAVPLPTARPANDAPKKEWVAWAVAQGFTPDNAVQMTKTDLIEKTGHLTVRAEAPTTSPAEVNADRTPGAEPPAVRLERPGAKAHKADWVAYAVANGMSEEDASSATLTDLQKKYPA